MEPLEEADYSRGEGGEIALPYPALLLFFKERFLRALSPTCTPLLSSPLVWNNWRCDQRNEDITCHKISFRLESRWSQGAKRFMSICFHLCQWPALMLNIPTGKSWWRPCFFDYSDNLPYTARVPSTPQCDIGQSLSQSESGNEITTPSLCCLWCSSGK